jgi:hypothetical protein
VGGVVGAVLALAAPAFATVPITQVSTDPYTNTTSFHATELEPDTFSFGSTIVGVFQTGRFPDGGSNDTGWATTTNNGTSWTNGFLPSTTVYSTPPGPWARVSDPSVAFDAKHNVWMISSLAIDNTVTGKAVIVSRSTDGGLTWTAPVTVSQGGGGSFYDKEWVACDSFSSSPNYGNCYAEWDDANAGDRLMMSRSTDGGLTWTASSVPSASVIGGQPLALPNGTVVVPITGSGAEAFVSTNGGSSYTGPFTISSIQTHGAPFMRDGEGLVSAEVDGAGTVYVAWVDCRFRTSCSADDVVYSTSTNGTSWSAVKRVPAFAVASTAEIFLAGISVDRTTSGASAHLGVAFYAMPKTNCSTSTCKIMGAFISSTNAGTSWSRPTLMFGPFKETQLANAGGFFLGDYMSTSFGSNGKNYPVMANATGAGTCQLGQITSCAENMVAPTNGVAATGGSVRSETGPVYAGGRAISARGRTAF